MGDDYACRYSDARKGDKKADETKVKIHVDYIIQL